MFPATVMCRCRTPTALTPEQEDVLRQLAALRGEATARGAARPDPSTGSSPSSAARSAPADGRPPPPMTLPLFRLTAGGLDGRAAGDPVALTGPEGRHAATVRRIRVGEEVLLADGRGASARARVTAAGRDELETTLLELRSEPEPDPRFVLVQALAKGGRDEAAVEAATELGVDEVVPWQAARSVVVWRGEKAARGARRWAATARPPPSSPGAAATRSSPTR